MRALLTYCVVASSLIIATSALADDLSTSTPSTALASAPACPAPSPADPSAWARSVALGFSYTDGNSNTSFLDLAGSVARDFENNIWEFKANYAFAESESDSSEERETTKNEFNAKGVYKRVLDERWFVGFGTDFRHDEVADIDYRVTLTPTVGYFLLRDDDINLSVEAGPSYIFEKVGDEDEGYLAPRVANKFEWKLSETSKLFQSAELLLDASNSDNYIINAEVGAEAALNTMLALVFVVRDAYDNQPAPDREKNDVAVVTSLKLTI